MTKARYLQIHKMLRDVRATLSVALNMVSDDPFTDPPTDQAFNAEVSEAHCAVEKALDAMERGQ